MMIVSLAAELVLQSQRTNTHYRTIGFIELCVYYIQVLADVSLASLLLATTQTECTLQLSNLRLQSNVFMNPSRISSYTRVSPGNTPGSH
jgi:hypothetical protein